MDTSFLTPVVWCILITETVERFSYYGFRAVLVLYFVNSLAYKEESAIALYAYTTCLAYSSPLLGSILADGLWGRFKTILWFGWTYCIGLVILTAGAFTEDNLGLQRILSFWGLFLTCLGTGGIKPCVSAFGADQVAHMDDAKNQEKPQFERIEQDGPLDSPAPDTNTDDSEKVRAFFASFYFCINLGALTSIFTIPIVRANFGFGAAFLLPTIMISLAMLAFLSKRKEYVHHVPDGTSLLTTFRLCFYLIRQDVAKRITCLAPNCFPLNDAATADDTLFQQQLSDAQQAVKVLPIMALFPIFWMLYDQQASVWTLQANRMNLHGLEPEQIAIVNPVEILIFIPVFDRIIYPTLESRWNVKVTHMLRMKWGMFLAAVSFVLSGLLESRISSSDQDVVSVFWQLPQLTILAIAEIFVSVTGLEFAYATSPKRLKAFLMGVYLLMTAVGNFLGGILYSSVFQTMERASIMHTCALLMLLNLGMFCWVAKSYEAMAMDDDSHNSNDEPSLVEMNVKKTARSRRKHVGEEVELMVSAKELL